MFGLSSIFGEWRRESALGASDGHRIDLTFHSPDCLPPCLSFAVAVIKTFPYRCELSQLVEEKINARAHAKIVGETDPVPRTRHAIIARIKKIELTELKVLWSRGNVKAIFMRHSKSNFRWNPIDLILFNHVAKMYNEEKF